MWHHGDYRVIFRHEQFPDSEKVRMAAAKMNQQISEKLFVQVMSIVVVQKRIHENDLYAWATLAVGYSFCGPKDHFNRHKGRQLAFERALEQVKEPHKNEIIALWQKTASKSCRALFEGK